MRFYDLVKYLEVFNQTLLQLKKFESEANVKPMTPSKIPVGNFRKAHLIDFLES